MSEQKSLYGVKERKKKTVYDSIYEYSMDKYDLRYDRTT